MNIPDSPEILPLMRAVDNLFLPSHGLGARSSFGLKMDFRAVCSSENARRNQQESGK
jgi:hypothetical protein